MKADLAVFDLTLAVGPSARAVEIQRFDDLSAVSHALGLAGKRPTLILVGGAGRLSPRCREILADLFRRVLAPMAERAGLVLIDGGTDSGIMRLIGEARQAIGATFPLLGVAARGTLRLPGASLTSQGVAAAPYHSHFLLVPGAHWGDESPWLAKTAKVIAGGRPSAALVANGGEVTWQDVAACLDERISVMVLAGSGGTADRLAEAARGRAGDDRARRMVETGRIDAVDILQSDSRLSQALWAAFAPIGE